MKSPGKLKKTATLKEEKSHWINKANNNTKTTNQMIFNQVFTNLRTKLICTKTFRKSITPFCIIMSDVTYTDVPSQNMMKLPKNLILPCRQHLDTFFHSSYPYSLWVDRDRIVLIFRFASQDKDCLLIPYNLSEKKTRKNVNVKLFRSFIPEYEITENDTNQLKNSKRLNLK